MSYTEFLKKLDSSVDGSVLFLAVKTKNIYQIDHLVEKKFLPAVFTRLEMAAEKNELDKVGELKRVGLEIAPIEYIDDIRAKMDEIVKQHTPKLVRKSTLSIG